jgi:hypothetical protein
MALWTWVGTHYEKCPWYALSKGVLPAVLYGAGQSLNSADPIETGALRVVQNWAVKKVEPHIWIGMDDPNLFGKQYMDTPFRKVLRGSFADVRVDGIPAKEYPETYFIDVEVQDKAAIFFNRGLDCKFYWGKNTMSVALHMLLWMGFKHIIFSGIDLCGAYFDNKQMDAKLKEDTDRLLAEEFTFMTWFAAVAKQQGIKLVNRSDASRLKEIEGIETCNITA